LQKPTIPENEVSRLAVLASLGILDTGANERFDRITRIAQRVFNTPIVLVSLVDENRQWFKSCLGLNVSETSRDVSFCGHAILSENILVINNALKDERFYDNPLVVDYPNIRFYAGCPLTVFGVRIGTLCIIDTKPREFSVDEKMVLKDLAQLVEDEFKTKQLAYTDMLTNIPNRKGFMDIVSKGIALSKRKHIESSICFFDLNNFKGINDTFGHNEGDLVLKTFSKALTNEARDSDVIGRLGGDEFIVWLSNCKHEYVDEYLQRLSSILEKVNNDNIKYRIEFAYGVKEIDCTSSETLDEIINAADEEMYINKGESRRKT